MDQGIIYCVKLYYRRLLMQSLIANVDKISVLSELSTEYRIATEKTRQKTLHEFWNL